MTPREHKLLAFITSFICQHGYPPSFTEMAEAMGCKGRSSAFEAVNSLIRQGKLEKTKANDTRGIRLVSSLANFADAELVDELERRGFKVAIG